MQPSPASPTSSSTQVPEPFWVGPVRVLPCAPLWGCHYMATLLLWDHCGLPSPRPGGGSTDLTRVGVGEGAIPLGASGLWVLSMAVSGSGAVLCVDDQHSPQASVLQGPWSQRVLRAGQKRPRRTASSPRAPGRLSSPTTETALSSILAEMSPQGPPCGPGAVPTLRDPGWSPVLRLSGRKEVELQP